MFGAILDFPRLDFLPVSLAVCELKGIIDFYKRRENALKSNKK